MDHTDHAKLLEKLRLVTKLAKQQNFPGALYALEHCRKLMADHDQDERRARSTTEPTANQ